MTAALREAGYDVTSVTEAARGATDLQVLRLAREDRRVLLTEDRDFGRLVFAHEAAQADGVVYIRCPEWARSSLPASIVSLVARHGPELRHNFVVWTPRRVRLRSLDSE